MTDPSAHNLQLVREAYAAFARGDLDAVVASMHPDIAWHEAEHSPWHAPGGHHGPDAVVTQVFARLAADFDRFEVEPSDLHDAGSTVVVEGRYRGSAAGSEAPLDAQVCHVWVIRDGKLAEFRQYTDTWQLARLTGAPDA